MALWALGLGPLWGGGLPGHCGILSTILGPTYSMPGVPPVMTTKDVSVIMCPLWTAWPQVRPPVLSTKDKSSYLSWLNNLGKLPPLCPSLVFSQGDSDSDMAMPADANGTPEH